VGVCVEAEDGLSAVEQAAILKPDLVILDYQMPNLDGLQAGQAIHAADPSVLLLLFTLDDITAPLQELALVAGFRGALARVREYSQYRRLSKFCFKVKLFSLVHRNRVRGRP
jgi:CheY-like chemotaxis protein